MAGTYADWRGHVIVCGLRGLGLRIVEELSLSGVPAAVLAGATVVLRLDFLLGGSTHIGPYEELLTVLRRDRPSPQAPGPARSLTRANDHRTAGTTEPE